MKLNWTLIIGIVIAAIVIIVVVYSYNERRKEEAAQEAEKLAIALGSGKIEEGDTKFAEIWEAFGQLGGSVFG